MKTAIISLFVYLVISSCSQNTETETVSKAAEPEQSELVLTAMLKSSYSNFSNPADRNFYFLIETRLINNTAEVFEFYTLSCGSLVNIITDSRNVSFLYHICPSDYGILVRLKPKQEYSIPFVVLVNKYETDFGISYTPRFGFIISRPDPGFPGRNVSLTNQDIISELKIAREKQDKVIWSDPITLSTNNYKPYEIRNIINDSTYTTPALMK